MQTRFGLGNQYIRDHVLKVLLVYRPLMTDSTTTSARPVTFIRIMSADPYHEVQREIQSSLQTASTLRSSFLRIRSLARDGSEELVLARNEVRLSLAYCSNEKLT